MCSVTVNAFLAIIFITVILLLIYSNGAIFDVNNAFLLEINSVYFASIFAVLGLFNQGKKNNYFNNDLFYAFRFLCFMYHASTF